MKFTRILLKLSGEALMSDGEQYCHEKLSGLAQAIARVTQMGVQVGVVVGAGNIFRARSANLQIVDRVTADNVGMLATIMNAAILRDYLRGEGLRSRVLSPREQRPLTKSFARDEALELMNRGHVLIFAGGTGNPYFTTDSAAALRALEISADALLKGTQQRTLDVQRQRGDFIEEQGALVRGLEVAFLVPDRACERAAPVPEQLRFDQAVGDSAAVDRDEGLARTFGLALDGGDHFLERQVAGGDDRFRRGEVHSATAAAGGRTAPAATTAGAGSSAAAVTGR